MKAGASRIAPGLRSRDEHDCALRAPSLFPPTHLTHLDHLADYLELNRDIPRLTRCDAVTTSTCDERVR